FCSADNLMAPSHTVDWLTIIMGKVGEGAKAVSPDTRVVPPAPPLCGPPGESVGRPDAETPPATHHEGGGTAQPVQPLAGAMTVKGSRFHRARRGTPVIRFQGDVVIVHFFPDAV